MSQVPFYKIRRKTDNLFSMGGSRPSFNKKGKTWTGKGHITNHVHQLDKKCYRTGKKIDPYADCEIVTCEMVIIDQEDMQDYMVAIAAKKAVKDANNREDRLIQQKEYLLEQQQIIEQKLKAMGT